MNTDLDDARKALEHGRSKEALRLAWRAAIASITRDDKGRMTAAIEIAEAIRDRSTGRTQEEASKLVALVAYARDHPQPPRIFGVKRDRR